MTTNVADCQTVCSLTPVIPALIALVGVIVGALLGARLSFRNQFRLSTLQSRQKAYSDLMGKKALLTQLYVSRFEAFAYSDYHERLWHLAGAPKDSIDFSEAQRWMRKSEDFAIDIAKARQSLFESIGTVRASYPATPKLDELSERIYKSKAPLITPPPEGANRTGLEQWKQQVIPDLQRLVQSEYAEPIDALLECMKHHLNDRVQT